MGVCCASVCAARRRRRRRIWCTFVLVCHVRSLSRFILNFSSIDESVREETAFSVASLMRIR